MRFFSILFLLASLTFTITAFAQTDDFTVRILLGVDTISPSTPVLLSAEPITTTQIDLDWSASTDNFSVSGYVVFRDSLPLATTTLTSYSDTGLTASTTYSYFIRAFDAALNYSSSSNSIATTTPNPVVVVENQATSTQTESTAVRAVLDNLYIDEDYTSALFTIATKRPSRIELRWGRTTSYELGYVVNNNFTSEYQTTITDLEPGTTYEYEIIGYTPRGSETLLKRGQFTTLKKTESVTVQNISRFLAIGNQADVQLSWQLPNVNDIGYVRIVRSHLGFPTHLQDGAVVYQGTGESFLDEDILEVYSPVYYTAFVVDSFGNVSSGAVAKVFAHSDSDVVSTDNNLPIPVDVTPIEIFNDNATTSDTLVDTSTTDFRIPDLSEIFIIQGDQHFVFDSEIVKLVNSRPFTISVPREVVSRNLKTIIMTLVDPVDTRQQYSFLLKINKDQSAYEAVVSPLSVFGSSWILLDIYDYESKVVSSYRKKILFIGDEEDTSQGTVLFPDMFIEHKEVTFGALTLLLLWIFLLLYKKSRDEDNVG